MIAAEIGNNNFIYKHSCDECGKESWEIVEIGEEPYYESATARICLDCLEIAAGKLKALRK